jgi:pimeloyl-ACP methyl ester carboxylesterase
LNEAELDVFVREYARTGFGGVLNRYRSLVRDWEESADIADALITAPTLFLSGDREPAVMFGSLEPMKAMVPNLREIVLLPGGGHWIQQERAAEVNEALVAFLAREVIA